MYMIGYFLLGLIQYYGLIFLFVRHYNNPHKITNRTIAFTHAIITTVTSGIDLYIENNLEYDSENTLSQIYIMNFSLSYFIMDLLYLIFMEWNLVFIMHHLLSIVMFSSILNFEISGYCIMLALFYGEITNPIRMIWIELSKRKSKYSNSVLTLFKISFIGIRHIILPYYMINAIYFFIYESVPLGRVLPSMIAIYIILFTLISCGNIVWTYKLIKTKNNYNIIVNPE